MESKTCEHCGKVIEGLSKGQVDHNMAVHKMTKHKEVNKNGESTTEETGK